MIKKEEKFSEVITDLEKTRKIKNKVDLAIEAYKYLLDTMIFLVENQGKKQFLEDDIKIICEKHPCGRCYLLKLSSRNITAPIISQMISEDDLEWFVERIKKYLAIDKIILFPNYEGEELKSLKIAFI